MNKLSQILSSNWYGAYKRTILFIFIIHAFSYCNLPPEKSINIATAANVQFAMDTIAAIFEKETGIKANIILGSSGKLTAQILQGAPYDIFVSANMKYPMEIYKKNMALRKPEVYAYGSLVLWTLKDSVDPDITILTNTEIRRIAIANPKTAPYGIAALELLQNLGIFEQIKDKLVYGESISQVNQFITSKTADIGFSAKSVVLSSKMKNMGSWSVIDSLKYTPIEQGALIIKKDEAHLKEAEKFLSFLFSTKVKCILSDFGYKTE
jgi:molybdate transport system substrate-binding protein